MPRDDFDVEKEGQVEIIGWLYQYYNEEPHDQVVNINGGPVKTDDIPAATQLFTTDWVVRYMVDNSLGKKYLEHYPDSPVKGKLKYLLPGDITPDQSDFDITRIQVMDNAMGSGHILAYAFDVLMTMYEDQGYAKREAANSIIQNNLFGLEIDRRAFQLSYFSLMMKLRRYDRQALNRSVMPNIHVFIAAPAVTEEFLHSLKASSEVIDEIQDIAAHFMDAKTLGSIIELPANYDYAGMRNALEPVATAQKISLFGNQQTAQQLLEIIATAETMTQRYDVVVTNPPYLNKMNSTLKKYVKKHYKDYSTDLFSIFIWHNINMTKDNGYSGYMTPVSWMFLKSFEKLRNSVLKLTSIASLIQMETHAYFDEAYVTINTFVLKKSPDTAEKVGTYLRLVDFTGGMEVQRQRVVEAITNPSVKYLYRTNQANFEKIPGSPLAYWVSKNLFTIFASGTPMGDLVTGVKGLFTGDNVRFLRQWFEVNRTNVSFDSDTVHASIQSGKRWFPCNKGGTFRRWYGNYDYIIDWYNDGIDIRNFSWPDGRKRSSVPDSRYLFTESITWSDVTSGMFSMRYRPAGSVSESVGLSAFTQDRELLFTILGLCNSKPLDFIMNILNPTIHAGVGYFSKIPVILPTVSILPTVNSSVCIAHLDWDSFEISSDFKCHEIVAHIAEHTVLVICHIHRRISKIRVTAKHPFKKLATWWHKIQNVPKKCQTFGLGGH